MTRIWKIFTSCLLFLFASIPAVYASDFRADYDVTYTVNDTGRTLVTQQVSLTNKQSNLYAQQYAITIDSTKITNVSASDSVGEIIPQITLADNKTNIRLAFNDEVVGLGKTLKFTLRYEDESITKKNGSIWEVNIPGITNDDDLGNYSVRLKTPASFGQPAYLVPVPKEKQTLVWSKEQLINGGVSAAFGTKQIFDMSISYFIENPKSQTVITEIALPPNSAYQQIFLQSLDPQPLEIISDEDHNWLARYRLPPQSSLTIQANILAEIYLQMRSTAYPLDLSLKQEYLRPTKYWQVNDLKIQELAKTYTTPKAIYDYVVSTLDYDYDKVTQQITRQGAAAALANPTSAVCMEFTDLFIAVARAAGIPARQAIGYAYTTNPRLRPLSLVTDVLHAWPEYYDESLNRWVGVDPTWGNTTGGVDYFSKLDFNHIVFAYNGMQDNYPYPAGFYRQTGKQTRDVEVRFFTGTVPAAEPSLTVTFQTPQRVTAGLPTQGSVIIENRSSVAAEQVQIQVQSEPFHLAPTTKSSIIPPFGRYVEPLPLHVPELFFSGTGIISASVNGATYRHTIRITPAYHIFAPAAIIAIWLFITLTILIRRLRKQ
jgi:transglutaminase-like putative cysteine protease